MSCATVATVFVAFLAGYGWCKAEESVLAFIFDREESPMLIVSRVGRGLGGRIVKVFSHRTTVSTWTVVLSLAISCMVAGWMFLQGQADNARSECSIEFNRLSALARDDRVNAQLAALQAQIDLVRGDIDYQTGLRNSLLSTHSTLDDIVSTFDAKVADDKHLLSKLNLQQTVAATHAYPPPDFCEGR